MEPWRTPEHYYGERERCSYERRSLQDDHARIGTYRRTEAKRGCTNVWSSDRAAQPAYGSEPGTQKRRQRSDVNVSELKSIKEMLSSLARLQGDNISNACEKIRSIETKFNEKIDNLEGKFVGLHSTIRVLDQHLASQPILQEKCDSISPRFLQNETCCIIGAQEPYLTPSDAIRAVDLQLRENVVYADSDEEDNFMVIEGSLGFGVIVDAKPKPEFGRATPLQTPTASPELCTVASVDSKREKPSRTTPTDVHAEQAKDPSGHHRGKLRGKRPTQSSEPADPGKFTITCSIGDQQLNGCILDLGSSNSIMPLKIAEKLGTPEMRETTAPLVLGDGTLCHPRGIIDNIPVRFKGHILCTTFIVTDTTNGLMNNIILGRPFLSAAGAEIFVAKERVDFYLGQKREKHQVWMRKKAKPAKVENVIRLSECSFMQETPELDEPAEPEQPNTPRRRKRVRKRRVKPPPGEAASKPIMEWRVRESHDPGGGNPKGYRKKGTVLDVRDPPLS